MEKGSIMIVATCIVSFAYLASGIPGTATFYIPEETDYMEPVCYYTPIESMYEAAVDKNFGFKKSMCGRMYHVRCTEAISGSKNPCTGENVTVKINYISPYTNSMDLSVEAFSIIADPRITHTIKIEYQHENPWDGIHRALIPLVTPLPQITPAYLIQTGFTPNSRVNHPHTVWILDRWLLLLCREKSNQLIVVILHTTLMCIEKSATNRRSTAPNAQSGGCRAPFVQKI